MSRHLDFKHRVHQVLEPSREAGWRSRWVHIFIVVLIVLNVIAVMLETVKPIHDKHYLAFKIFDDFSVGIFIIEYLLRVWVCTLDPRYSEPVKGRIRYILSTGALIDLMAIVPFLLPLIFHFDLRAIRTLRLIRFFRILKLGRYTTASRMISTVLRSRKEELMLSFSITLFLIVIASTLMYFVEHDAQPDKFASIPETMWWSVATLTTVGYGDVYPVTPYGKLLAGCIAVLGIGLFALPAGILASAFSEHFHHKHHFKQKCPHCGEEIELELDEQHRH